MDLEMGRLFRIIQVDFECNRTHPYERGRGKLEIEIIERREEKKVI